MFGFVLDPRLHDLQLIVLSFSTFYSSSLCRTGTIAFAKLNKPPASRLPLANKPSVSVTPLSSVLETEINPPKG